MPNTGNTQQIINYGATANDGTGDPLRTAFIKTDENFDNVWLAGPVGSNITISNNTIQTNNTNGNIIIKPNGTGIIQANASIIPNSTGTRDLGSSAQSWRRAYVDELLPATLTVSGDAVIGGNLTIEGDTIQIGNITTDTLTVQLANTAANKTAANGAGITVGANDAIATFLFNSTSNTWVTNIGANIGGNVTASYFIGNGSLLTGITSTGNYVFTNNQMSISNEPMEIVATGAGADVDIQAADAVFIEALAGEVDIRSADETFITTNSGGNIWTFYPDGTLSAPGTITTTGNVAGDVGLFNDVNLNNASQNKLLYTDNDRNIYDTGFSYWSANGTISGSGNITAGYFIGNGSQLTGLPAAYGNANVAAYLEFFTGNISAGNLYVANNATVISDLFVKTGTFYGDTRGENSIYAGVPLFTNLGSDVVAQYSGNVNAYTQFNFQNGNTGTQSSGDYVITADNGNDTTHFLNIGLTGGNWDGTQPNSLGNDLGPNDGYFYVQDGNLAVGVKDGSTTRVWKYDNNGDLTVPGDIIGSTITSEDDVIILGGDKAPGSASAEGGDIVINGGLGRIDNGVSTGSGGDVRMIGGDGGDGVDSGAGTGGYVELQGGVGGIANSANSIQAGAGGYVLIVGGGAGDNDSNLSLSGIGGNVEIYGGTGSFDTANTVPYGAPGHVNLYGGNWGWITESGNIYLNTYDGSNFKTLTYDNQGNLTLPTNQSIIIDGGDGVIGPVSDDLVISWDNEEIRMVSVAGSIEMQADNAFRVQTNYDGGTDTYLSRWEFNQDEIVNITGDSAIVTEAGNLTLSGGRNGLSSGNTTVRAVNVGVLVADWIFDNTGTLTAPGNITTTGRLTSDTADLGNLYFSTGGIRLADGATESSIGIRADGGIGYAGVSIPNNATANTVDLEINNSQGNVKIQSAGVDGWKFGADNVLSAPGDITTTGNITGNTGGFAIGYRDIPQVTFSANTTAALTDAGKHYYSTTAGNLQLTLPDNVSVAIPTGATLTIVVNAAGNVLVGQGTGVTLYQAGSATTGNRVVGAYGLATVMKVAANTWVISGTGVY